MTSILALTSIAAMTADLFQLGPQKAIILLAERRHSSCPSYCMTSAAGLAHVGCYAIVKSVVKEYNMTISATKGTSSGKTTDTVGAVVPEKKRQKCFGETSP